MERLAIAVFATAACATHALQGADETICTVCQQAGRSIDDCSALCDEAPPTSCSWWSCTISSTQKPRAPVIVEKTTSTTSVPGRPAPTAISNAKEDDPLSPSQVQKIADANGFGFLKAGDLNSVMNLTTLLPVTFVQPASSFPYCNKTISHDAKDFTLTPAVDGPVETPWDLRSARSPFAMDDLYLYAPNISFEGEANKEYTFLIIHPRQKEGLPDYGESALVALYTGLQAVAGSISLVDPPTSVDEFSVAYSGPANPSKTHANQYEIMLLEQTQPIVIDPGSTEAEALQNRTFFDLFDFMSKHSLGSIRGVNWVYSYNDLWTNYFFVVTGFDPGAMNCTR